MTPRDPSPASRVGRSAASRTRAARQVEFAPERVSLSNGDAMIEATVQRISAATAFRANLKLLQSADQMSNELMELITRR